MPPPEIIETTAPMPAAIMMTQPSANPPLYASVQPPSTRAGRSNVLTSEIGALKTCTHGSAAPRIAISAPSAPIAGPSASSSELALLLDDPASAPTPGSGCASGDDLGRRAPAAHRRRSRRARCRRPSRRARRPPGCAPTADGDRRRDLVARRQLGDRCDRSVRRGEDRDPAVRARGGPPPRVRAPSRACRPGSRARSRGVVASHPGSNGAARLALESPRPARSRASSPGRAR